MTSQQIRNLIGDAMTKEISEDILSLTKSANADSHEGSEWLPRYKLALALLAVCIGKQSVVLSQLILAYGNNPEASGRLKDIQKECGELWSAHLKCVSD